MLIAIAVSFCRFWHFSCGEDRKVSREKEIILVPKREI